jgi:hypothetical protein
VARLSKIHAEKRRRAFQKTAVFSPRLSRSERLSRRHNCRNTLKHPQKMS